MLQTGGPLRLPSTSLTASRPLTFLPSPGHPARASRRSWPAPPRGDLPALYKLGSNARPPCPGTSLVKLQEHVLPSTCFQEEVYANGCRRAHCNVPAGFLGCPFLSDPYPEPPAPAEAECAPDAHCPQDLVGIIVRRGAAPRSSLHLNQLWRLQWGSRKDPHQCARSQKLSVASKISVVNNPAAKKSGHRTAEYRKEIRFRTP